MLISSRCAETRPNYYNNNNNNNYYYYYYYYSYYNNYDDDDDDDVRPGNHSGEGPLRPPAARAGGLYGSHPRVALWGDLGCRRRRRPGRPPAAPRCGALCGLIGTLWGLTGALWGLIGAIWV